MDGVERSDSGEGERDCHRDEIAYREPGGKTLHARRIRGFGIIAVGEQRIELSYLTGLLFASDGYLFR